MRKIILLSIAMFISIAIVKGQNQRKFRFGFQLENGITVSLSHLRGSNSIAQLSDCVIALERNQQSDDDIESRTTRLRILKSRYTGDVGMACSLLYDKETGRLSEYEDNEMLNSADEEIIPF